jgi:hypothetical protein
MPYYSLDVGMWGIFSFFLCARCFSLLFLARLFFNHTVKLTIPPISTVLAFALFHLSQQDKQLVMLYPSSQLFLPTQHAHIYNVDIQQTCT